METTSSGWTVLDENAGILTREYAFAPKANARMMIARGADGLVAISPGSNMPDAAFAELERFGKVTALVAPNGFHHLGLPEWKKAFPAAAVYAPTGAHPRIQKKQPALGAVAPLTDLEKKLGPDVEVVEAVGYKTGETWLLARGARGPVWYVSDTFFSMTELPEAFLPRIAFKWTGSAPGFRAARAVSLFLAKDRPALRAWVKQRAAASSPAIVLTAHGAVVDEPKLGETMQRLADRL